MASRYPEEARELYPGVVEAIMKGRGRPPKYAPPPERVARVIARALRSRRPKTRYLVGHDARAAAFLRWLLPDRAMDWLVDRVH